MFVYSVKPRQIKLVFLIIFIIMTVLSLFILSLDSQQTGKGSEMNINASDHSERMAFISQYGWQVDEEPAEVMEIIIPETFDETYTAYNEIQKNQGFDLSLFAGNRLKRWSYVVRNYTGYENKDCIRINLLVRDGVVVGGDVCSVELDGFMHGFEMITSG